MKVSIISPYSLSAPSRMFDSVIPSKLPGAQASRKSIASAVSTVSGVGVVSLVRPSSSADANGFAAFG